MNDVTRSPQWVLDLDDVEFCDVWRSLEPEERRELGSKALQRYLRLTDDVSASLKRLAREQAVIEQFAKKHQQAREEGLRVEHLPENWQGTRPPARPFILPPYIPRRAVSALIGAGTASKTMLLCEWVVAIITGTAWREHSVQQGDVVILTWEDETADYHAKLHSLLNYARPDLLHGSLVQDDGQRVSYPDLIRDRLHIIPMHGTTHRLVGIDERGRPAPTILPYRVVELIKAEHPATVQVFIETVSRANAADESNEALASVVAAGEIIAHELDSGVTGVHHTSKAAAVNGIIDAHAGRGGSALVDNSRASTVIALVNAEMPQALWPAGFGTTDFVDREIVLVENARSSYARKAVRMHLERIYPDAGAPYLRAVRSPTQADPAAPRRDPDAEKLIAWLQADARKGQWLAEREIVKRFKEYDLTERAAGNALARAREGGSVEWKDEKQYGDKGRMVTRYRLKGPCDK